MKNKKKIILTVIVVLLFGIIGAFSIARFIKLMDEGYFFKSKNFYFTSNRLADNNPTYQISDWSGVGQFDIEFDLVGGNNNLNFVDYDIEYQVTFECPSDVNCSTNKSTGTIYASSSTHSDNVTVVVNPSRVFEEGETLSIKVIAKSTSPYEKTITAIYNYSVQRKGLYYEIVDEVDKAYLYFKIVNAVDYCTVIEAFDTYNVGDAIDSITYNKLNKDNKKKCVSQRLELSFDPNDIIIDSTNSYYDKNNVSTININGTNYINKMIIDIAPASSVGIKFYKKNKANNYTYPIVNNSSVIGVNYLNI